MSNLYRFRVPIFREGLNESGRPDLIGDQELTECTNYVFTRDGVLELRPGEDLFTDPVNAPYTGVITRIWTWKSTFFPDGANEDRDYIFLIYTSSGEFWLLMWDGTDWVSGIRDELDNPIPAFEDMGEIRLTRTDIGISIVDGREYHVARFIEIRSDGRVVYGDLGLPAPISRATVSPAADNNRYVPQDTLDPGMSIPRGAILFACYTIVTDDGLESNPSPITVSTDLQYIMRNDDMEIDQIWQRALLQDLRTAMADRTMQEGFLDTVKYFNVYMGWLQFTEGVGGLAGLYLASRIQIGDLEGNNLYVSTSPFTGRLVSYENDQSCKGDDICYTGGMTFISNANVRASFSFEFDHYFRITLRNNNSRHYVEGAIWIRLYDSDLVDKDGNPVIEWGDYTIGDQIDTAMKDKFRIYDQDLTTLLPVIYLYTDGNDYLDIMVKVPYLAGYLDHDIYLAFGGEGIPEAQVGQTDFRTPAYGDWVDIRADWDDQEVIRPIRVRNASDELIVSCEWHDTDYASNRAGIGGRLSFAGSLWEAETLEYMSVMGYSRILTYTSTNDENALRVNEGGAATSQDLISKPFPTKGYIAFYTYVRTDVGAPDHLSNYMVFSIFHDSNNYLGIQRNINVVGTDMYRMIGSFGGVVRISAWVGDQSYATPKRVFLSWDRSSSSAYLYIRSGTAVENHGTIAIDIAGLPDGSVGSYRFLLYPGVSALSGARGYYSQIMVNFGEYVGDINRIRKIAMLLPDFPEEEIGFNVGDDVNHNVTVHPAEELVYDTRIGMIKFSNVGGRTFPDLNFVFAKGLISRIIPAPSYLRDGSYLNCVVVFGEDFRQRLLLKGEPGNWQAVVHELLMDEKVHFGLGWRDRDSLLRVAESLYWLSGNKFIRENSEGMVFLNYKGGVEVVGLEYPSSGRDRSAFFDSINNSIVLYDREEYEPPAPPPIPPPPGSRIYHVRTDGDDGNDGLSWGRAWRSINYAVGEAVAGDQIWVKRGIYYPDDSYGSYRLRHFRLKTGVGIYGGFLGHETQLDQRIVADHYVIDPVTEAVSTDPDILVNQSVLHGLNPDGLGSKHVIWHDGGAGLDNTAILDGFLIYGGAAYADEPDQPHPVFSEVDGGGILLNGSHSPIIRNCGTMSCTAERLGGGVCLNGGMPLFEYFYALGCYAKENGGGVGIDDTYSTFPRFICLTIRFCKAGDIGSAIYNKSSMTIINGQIDNCDYEAGHNSGGTNGVLVGANNSACYLINVGIYRNINNATSNTAYYGLWIVGAGSSIYGRNLVVYDNRGRLDDTQIVAAGTVSIDYSNVENGYAGPNNIDATPVVANNDSNFRILAGDPGIDLGDDTEYNPGGIAENVDYDLDGEQRIAGTRVDMGGYEYRP